MVLHAIKIPVGLSSTLECPYEDNKAPMQSAYGLVWPFRIISGCLAGESLGGYLFVIAIERLPSCFDLLAQRNQLGVVRGVWLS